MSPRDKSSRGTNPHGTSQTGERAGVCRPCTAEKQWRYPSRPAAASGSDRPGSAPANSGRSRRVQRYPGLLEDEDELVDVSTCPGQVRLELFSDTRACFPSPPLAFLPSHAAAALVGPTCTGVSPEALRTASRQLRLAVAAPANRLVMQPLVGTALTRSRPGVSPRSAQMGGSPRTPITPRPTAPAMRGSGADGKALLLSPAEWRALGAQAQAQQLLEYAQAQLGHAHNGAAALAFNRSQLLHGRPLKACNHNVGGETSRR